MKVLHLINAFNPGGVERWLLSMLEEIPRDVAAMDVCCKGADTGPWAPDAIKLGATVYHCPLRVSHVDFVSGLTRILREGEYDVVQNHLGVYSGCGTWIARRNRVPVIVTFHNTEFRPTARFFSNPVLRRLREYYAKVSIGYALRKSTLIATVSEGVRDRVVPKTPELMAKSRILRHGISLPKLPTEKERAGFRFEFGWPSDAPVVIHVGKFTEQKNHVGLLSVFERVLKRIPTARLVCVGVGPLKGSVESVIRQRGLDESIRMLGARPDACTLMALCDVFLFPSLFEGFGLAALEANAAALPVVASRIKGLTEAVEDCRTALLHEVDDTDGMADSVVKILEDRDYARQLGQAGRVRAQEQFSLSRSTCRLLELFTECVASGTGRPC